MWLVGASAGFSECLRATFTFMLQSDCTLLTSAVDVTSWLSYLLTHSLIHSLTPYSKVLLEKITGSQLVKKFPKFYGTRKFITAFTSARHLSLFWASSIQSILPHPTFWRSILILSSHPILGLPSGLFPSGFPTKTLSNPLLAPIRTACTAHLILLDFIARTIFSEQYRSLTSSLCSFLHSPVTSSLLGPNFLKHPRPTSLPQCERPGFTPIQTKTQNYSSVYLDLYIFG